MGRYDEFYEARALVKEVIEADLVGPVEQNEVLRESPLSYYVAGKLYPQGMDDTSMDEDGGSEVDDLEDSYETPLTMSSQRRQSSLGMTFAVRPDTESLRIAVEYATYDPLDEDEARDLGYSEKFLDNDSASRVVTYLQRRPFSDEVVWSLRQGSARVPVGVGAHLDVRMQPVAGVDVVLITVTLINVSSSASRALENATRALFQCGIRVALNGGGEFLPADMGKPSSADSEVAELEMLYRHARVFALGHGSAVDWDHEGDSPSWVKTVALPFFEVRQMRPRELPALECLSMKHLAHASVDRLSHDLGSLVDSYEAWIGEQAVAAESLSDDFQAIAVKNIERCRRCAARMREGISTLASENLPLHAFRLANEAMLLQRLRSQRSKGNDLTEDDIHWYPFQLGFLLMEIAPIAHPSDPERDIADLLWFPTGGGKTEAYLGVAAYTMFLRRLKNPDDGGVAVIMRYTLRLLTMQQFERATALIAACEILRKEHGLGGDKFSIGMYVGQSLTPNTLKEAGELLSYAQSGKVISEGNPDPLQVRRCPWCGRPLSPGDYEVVESEARMYSRCPDEKCEFHHGDGIPAHVVDEDIYAHPPTFIVATVDKFAQVPLKEDAASLLGVGKNYSPPELIIQDELHLISGPLGTMVGLYETAICRLCTKDGIRPKIITSTATARSSRDQQLSLYGADSFQFPPQGLDLRDSFFAIEANPSEKPSRLYMGVMGPDAAITGVSVRASAALLFATRYLETCDFSEDVVDSFWTIVEYFNTLRELGGSLTSLLDSVQAQFSFLVSTKFKDRYPLREPTGKFDHILELTSRRSSADITSAFSDLEIKHAKDDNGDSVDFVLATNMLSVGVDIGRLGTMIVYGQPKMNSEYVQATSRVGRSTPGLVITLLDPKRSRDRSHYEQFISFHQALYKIVESSTLTPFSDRARDRGLHTLFVTLIRYTVPGLQANDGAADFRADMDGVDSVKNFITDYVQRIDPSEVGAVRRELEYIAEEWEKKAVTGLCYYNSGNPTKSLFKNDLDDDRFRAMHSMRSVEPSAGLFLLR